MTPTFTFPMRVRCVDNMTPTRAPHLVLGREYVAVKESYIFVFLSIPEERHLHPYYKDRFKPIVRVKAKCVASLDLLLKRSAAAVRAMTPEAREAMMQAQRQSWVRGEMALSAAGLG